MSDKGSILLQVETYKTDFKNLQQLLREESRKYDSSLRQMYSLIWNATAGRDVSCSLDGFFEVDDKWLGNFRARIDDLVDNIGMMDSRVRKFVETGITLPESYTVSILRMNDLLGHPFRFEDASKLLQDILLFRRHENLFPILETNDKARDYLNASTALQIGQNFKSFYRQFAVWVHDSRHYLERIRAQSVPTWKNAFLGRELMAIDALESALYVTKRCVPFGGGDGPAPLVVAREFEPYKLFHKFQYCFSREFDRINWKRGAGIFRGRVRWVEGMENVVLNLYTNAAKYLPHDGKVHDVITSFLFDTKELKISVTSLGPYVDRQEIEKIFDAGYRAESADMVSRAGSGMGLASVKSVCDRAGYVVSAESVKCSDSQEGKWGMFTISIHIPKSEVISCGDIP